jgi:hypothetical protein
MSEPLERFGQLETMLPGTRTRRRAGAPAAPAASPPAAPAPLPAPAAAVDALLGRIEAVTQRATAAATAGEAATLSALLAERDALLAELGPVLRTAAGGASLPDAVAAAVERQLSAIVQRNLALHTIVSDARADVIAGMHELQPQANGER